MPQAYRHAFEQMGRVQAEMAGQAAPTTGSLSGAAAAGDGRGGGRGGAVAGAGAEGGGLSEAELEAMHARLRREIRHGLHLMVQESNPDSYYRDIEHVTPT